MRFSEYENIEIFNNTQSFSINKCVSQILSPSSAVQRKFCFWESSLAVKGIVGPYPFLTIFFYTPRIVVVQLYSPFIKAHILSSRDNATRSF
jgi:hypothetical protein